MKYKTLKINDLNQVRLLSDPLKLKLLQAFAESPRTTKQVAKQLGEGVTKLYRHVDALQEAGLLTVVSEQQKRGTVERTFQTVAHRFEVDQALFATSAMTPKDTFHDIFRAAESEIFNTIVNADKEQDISPIFTRMRIKARPEQIKQLHQQLQEWIESIGLLVEDEEASREDDGKAQEMGALLAFYPLDKNN